MGVLGYEFALNHIVKFFNIRFCRIRSLNIAVVLVCHEAVVF